MRILVLSHEFPPVGGGGANACFYLTKGFCDRGHEVTVITANYNSLPEKEMMGGVNVIRVASKRINREYCSFSEMLGYLIKAWLMAQRMVKENNYDICQVFFGIPSGPIGYWMKKKYHIPYIVRFGGGDIPGFQTRFNVIYKIISPILRLIWKNADRLVANSDGLQRLAYCFYDKKEVLVVTNGVDMSYYTPLERKNDKDVLQILFVSRLIERKGLQFLLPQIKQIVRKCNVKIHLTVVGDGPYRSTLEEMVKEEGIGRFVSFEGYKNRQQILEYYQAADIFVLPSIKEGMPNVVLEAMACGLPIVMTPCEGSKELVRNNGVVVKQDGLAQEIIRMCNDEKLRKSMGIESRRMVAERFRWDYIIDQYLGLMEDVILEKSYTK